MSIKLYRCKKCNFEKALMKIADCEKCGNNMEKVFSKSHFTTGEKSNAGEIAKAHIEETKQMLNDLKKEKWK